jgi:DNA anti-recombination protein RmuC
MTYEDYMMKLGKNLSVAVSSYNGATKEFKKIDKDIFRITGDAMGAELPLLEKPSDDGEEEREILS